MGEVVWSEFDGFEALESARERWVRALAVVGRPIPDIQPHRFIATERGMGERSRPYLAIGEADGEPVALIAGRIERSPVRLRFGYATAPTPRLSSLLTVYGGLASKAGSEGARAIAAHLQSLLRSGRVAHVRTSKLDVAGEEYGALAALPRVVRQAVERHWETELVPGSFEETMKRTHSGKHRRAMKRTDRKLVEAFDGDVEVEIVTRADQIEGYQRDVSEIWSQTYKASLASGRLKSSVWEAILQSEAEAGFLRCYTMRAKGKPIAYFSGFELGDVYWSSSMGFLPEHAPLSPGRVLMLRVFEDLCSRGARLVDWGFGDAEYKQNVGTRSHDEAMLHLYGSGLKATTTRQLDRASTAATAQAKRLLGSKATASLKRRWRERLQKRRQTTGDGDASE